MSLPPVRLPFISSKLRFSPLLTWWIADRQTHLHALRLGPAVLVGFPGDYSGHLADRLDASTRGSGLSNIATSFDGDFRGYLVSENVFHRKSCYETRWMSFYGPWTGEYFNDLARRMVLRLSNETIYSPWPAPTWMDLVARLALGLLLGSAVLVVWQGRGRSGSSWLALESSRSGSRRRPSWFSRLIPTCLTGPSSGFPGGSDWSDSRSESSP